MAWRKFSNSVLFYRLRTESPSWSYPSNRQLLPNTSVLHYTSLYICYINLAIFHFSAPENVDKIRRIGILLYSFCEWVEYRLRHVAIFFFRLIQLIWLKRDKTDYGTHTHTHTYTCIQTQDLVYQFSAFFLFSPSGGASSFVLSIYYCYDTSYIGAIIQMAPFSLSTCTLPTPHNQYRSIML